MSLKSIELQIALPKTQDIGKIQNHFHQRSDVEQSLLMSQMKQREVEKRKKTEKMSKSEMEEQNTTKTPKTTQNKSVKKDKALEPHKGKYIDLEL